MSTAMTGAFTRRFHLGILLVVLLAFGLRLYVIDRQDIWGDEAVSIWRSSRSLPELLTGDVEAHPPLYSLLLHPWIRLAGLSPLALRFLSAFMGTLLVPVIYVLGRLAFPHPGERGWGTADLAALLAAVSPVLAYYSQETRMYSLVTLLAAASVYWTMRAWVRPNALLPYFLTTVAAIYTHYYAFSILLVQNLVILPALLVRRRWSAAGRWLAVQGAIALAYLPWIAIQGGFLSGKANTRFDEWTLTAAGRIVGETLTMLGAGLAVSPTTGWTITALFLIAIVTGLPGLWKSRTLSKWLIVAYLFLPLLLAWIVNPFMAFFYPRYLLLIAPAFYLLAAWGVMTWGQLWRPLSIVGAVLLLLASALGLRGYYVDETYVKGRYGQMMAYIQDHAQPGDALILANQLQRPIYDYYQPEGLEAYFFPRYEYPLEDPRTARDLEAIAERHPRLWLVRFGNPAVYDPGGTLSRWLATHGSKAYFDGWVDADLTLYVMTPAAIDEEIQHPLRADLGEGVRLLGYAINTDRVAPGETLLLTLYWQSLAPMAESYTVFTHLLDTDGQIQAQMDSEPQGGSLPTDRWTVGQVVQDNYALTVSSEALPGPHVLEVGMYLLETLERLPVRDPDSSAPLGDRVLLGTVEVVAP